VICQSRLDLPTRNDADITEMATTVSLQRCDFRLVAGGNDVVPRQPMLPAVGPGISPLDFHDAGPFPVPAPPRRGMQAPEILSPPLAHVIGRSPSDFLHEPGARNGEQAARLHKPGDVVQVQVVRAEVREGIDTDYASKNSGANGSDRASA
jgi:hypothetical protein